ncbi:MAG: carbon-nitrogen hydrolase family protein [Gemmatimonadaceae bacterium]
MRVAIVQDEICPTLAEGLASTARLTREAATQGAELVVFPETWLPGYPVWLDVCRDVALWDHAPVKEVFARYAAESVNVSGDSGAALAAIARDAGVALLLGVTERVEGGVGHGTLYNSLLMYDAAGELRLHHRKLVPTFSERMVWGPGDAQGLETARVGEARVGGLICWEHWMPLARQALHEAGEDVHVALWPNVHEKLQLSSRHYAFEGRCYVLAAGSLQRASALPAALEPHPDLVTSPDQWVLRGGSAIVGPDGNYVVEPVFDEAAIIVAELPLERLRGERMSLDVAGHYARPDCFSFGVNRRRAGGS